jgi:hypothetical protein
MSTTVQPTVASPKPLRRILRRGGLALSINAAVVVAATGAVNYLIDGAGRFRNSYAERQAAETAASIARALQSPGATCPVSNVQNRIDVVTAYLQATDPRNIEVVHLGSSLQMVGGTELVAGGRRFLNACSGAAFLPQIIGMYALLREHGVAPRRVVLGADHWNFTDATPIASYVRELQPWIVKGYEQLGLELDPAVAALFVQEQPVAAKLEAAQELFNPQYARYNAKLWFDRWWAPAHAADEFFTYGSDLSVLRWSDRMENNQGTRDDVEGVVVFARGMRGLDKSTIVEARFDDFVALLDALDRGGADCELVLSPLNPASPMDHDARITRDEVEARVRSLAKQRGLIVRGTYDPLQLGLTEYDYVDWGHPRRAVYRRIFEYIADHRP